MGRFPCILPPTHPSRFCTIHRCIAATGKRRQCRKGIAKGSSVPACSLEAHQEELLKALRVPSIVRTRIRAWREQDVHTITQARVGRLSYLDWTNKTSELDSLRRSVSPERPIPQEHPRRGLSPSPSSFPTERATKLEATTSSLSDLSISSTEATPTLSNLDLTENAHPSWRVFSRSRIFDLRKLNPDFIFQQPAPFQIACVIDEVIDDLAILNHSLQQTLHPPE